MLILLLALRAEAQIAGDTLEGAEVRSLGIGGGGIPKGRYEAGTKTIGIGLLAKQPYLHENLATLLSGVTTAFVKSYGYNSFATLSFRGASAAQSAVYWEGIPIMNGATGLTDISLLPVSLLDSIALNYGGSAALYGSGNVGGAVMLRDARAVFTDGLEGQGTLDVSTASFHHYTGSGIFNLRTKQLFFNIGLEGMRAAGDFPTLDAQGRRFITAHAQQFRETAKAMLAWRIGAHDQLSAHYWLGRYAREIPRALFEAQSLKAQHDSEQRVLLQWRHSGTTSNIYAKGAWLSNRFGYEDSAIGLYTGLRSNQLFWEGGWEGHVCRRGSLLLFAPLQYFFLKDEPAQPSQVRAAIAGAYTQAFLSEHLRLAGNFRIESFDGRLIAMPGINAAFSPRPAFRIRANAQRSYRAQTLNELHYRPGGNADLKPERGWSFDAGYDLQRKTSAGLFATHSLTAYTRYIKDWIIWLGGAIWTPHNLAAVNSSGIETENALSGNWRQLKWRVGLNAAYTRSATVASYFPGDNSIGCQIPYVPLLTANCLAGLGWKAFYVEWHTTYTGLRYITSDESASLPAYWLGNLRVNYITQFQIWDFRFHAAINNVWNEQYQIVGFRPMPGINGSVGVTIHITER